MLSTRRAALTGVLAVGIALGVGELMAGLFDGAPSLITAVGSVVIPFVPPALEDFAIQTFGTSDKFVLHVSTVVVTLAIGAWAGIIGRKRFGSAATLFVVFGAVGVLAAVMQPLVSVPLAIASPVIAVAAGLYALTWLYRAAGLEPRLLPSLGGGTDERLGRLAASQGVSAEKAAGSGGPATATSTEGAEEPVDAAAEHKPQEAGAGGVSRRRFVLAATGAGVVAAVSATAGRLLLRSRELDTSMLTLPDPSQHAPSPGNAQAFEEIEGLAPIVVPNQDFYRIDTALMVPRINEANWRLKITGMVERPFEMSYRDLLNMEPIERYVTISCVSNEVGGDLVGNARWLGVPLSDVLDLARVQDGAGQIVGRAVDGWTAGFPTELAFDGRDAMIAFGMNGEPLPASHGFPARLIVPGLYGYVSATKWLSEIELTTWDDFDAYWIPRGWAKEGPIKTQSRVDVPRNGERVMPGETVIAGVAWAPTRGVERVEIQLNDGDWLECEMTEPLSDDAWVQWRRTVDLAAGEYIVQVRATDGTGATQPGDYVQPRPDGAEGWDRHRILVG